MSGLLDLSRDDGRIHLRGIAAAASFLAFSWTSTSGSARAAVMRPRRKGSSATTRCAAALIVFG